MTIRFSVSQTMVDAFVLLSGDRNSEHVDAEFARRFRYRRPVVHGMLPFAHLFRLAEALS
jgi:acyl dehydratase